MSNRAKDSYNTTLDDFLNEDVLVVCPSCQGKAIVKAAPLRQAADDEQRVRVICAGCGYSKTLRETPKTVLYQTSRRTVTGRVFGMGGAADPFFELPLWLTTPFEGELLWAYNRSHLLFIKAHVEASLRERNGQENRNRSLGSRLPRWMTSAKNRTSVSKKIDELLARC